MRECVCASSVALGLLLVEFLFTSEGAIVSP